MPKYIVYILFIASFLGLYFYRYQNSRPIYKEGDRIKITSTISEDPTVEGLQQKITIENLRVFVPRFPAFSYGDQLQVEGEVARGKGGYFLKEVQEVRKVQEVAPATSGGRKGFELRRKIFRVYEENLPEPHDGLLAGIVLGTKMNLDSRFVEALKKTGTIHIVVASGTNISIFAGGLIYLLINIFKAHRKAALAVAIIFIWAYIFFIGFQPPIVRAGIMGTIAFTAQILGKEAAGMRALLISAVLMLLVVPDWLFDLGFQLSFLATFGIILLGSRIERRLKSATTNKFGMSKAPIGMVGDVLSMTLAAQVAVLPLIYYKFGSFSWFSPLVNVLVVPVVPFIMAGGFLIGLISLMGPIGLGLAKILGWLVWLPLEYFVRVIDIFS